MPAAQLFGFWGRNGGALVGSCFLKSGFKVEKEKSNRPVDEIRNTGRRRMTILWVILGKLAAFCSVFWHKVGAGYDVEGYVLVHDTVSLI